jgi:hypothetical protein
MRNLTNEQQTTLEKRRREFPGLIEEIKPVLSDFAIRLRLENPCAIVGNPDAFLESIDQFMADQVIAVQDRVWIVTRLGYFVGQILSKRLEGVWLLNENPRSHFFLRYVIGQFARAPNPDSTVDPFEVANAFVSQPPPRKLASIIAEVERECLT